MYLPHMGVCDEEEIMVSWERWMGGGGEYRAKGEYTLHYSTLRIIRLRSRID